MSAESVKINENLSSGEYIKLKKSTFKTMIVIAAAVILGGIGLWYINACGYVPFWISAGGIPNLILTYVVYAAAALAAVLAVSAIVFRFVKFSYKVFVPVSAATSLLIGVRVVYDYITSMISSEFLPDFVNANSLESVLLYYCLIGLAVAAVVFALSMLFGRVIKRLAVK